MKLTDTVTKELATRHRSAEAFSHRGSRVFSSHCCCNAPPLLPRWQGRVDCMLWYALSRNLWMCRSIIAILYLIGHFSLPHLAEVSSPLPCPPSPEGYRSHMFTLSMVFLLLLCFFRDGHWIYLCQLHSFFCSGWGLVALSLSPGTFMSQKKRKKKSKVSKPVIFTLNCCRSPLQRGSTTTRQLCA